MGLYNIVMGDGHQQERGAVLLGILGRPEVARFRDAWVEKSGGGPVIAVYTRQGGGNRECSCADDGGHSPASCSAASNEELAAHPLYLRDRDDDFDGTYATFYFRVPAEWQALAAGSAVDPVDMSARWQEAIARVGTEPLSPAMTALGDQFAAMLSDESPDAPRIMEV